MTNKEFFKTLSKAVQKDIVSTLTIYDKVHVEYYNGEYHITPNWCLMAKYPSDYKVLNEFSKKEFDFQNRNYDLEWFEFWSAKEHKGEKNINGAWQAEFELIWDPIIENAIKKYIEEEKKYEVHFIDGKVEILDDEELLDKEKYRGQIAYMVRANKKEPDYTREELRSIAETLKKQKRWK